MAKHDHSGIAKYCKNHTLTQAAVRFGCSEMTVSRACRSHGVKPLNPKFQLRSSIAKWVRLNKATTAQAVEFWSVSASTVKRACHEHGVKIRFEPRAATGSIRIIAMANKGMSPKGIAEELGCSKQHVYKVLAEAKEHGVLVDATIRSKRKK